MKTTRATQCHPERSEGSGSTLKPRAIARSFTSFVMTRTALTLSPLLLVTFSSSAQADERTFYHHAVINPWLMALLFIATTTLMSRALSPAGCGCLPAPGSATSTSMSATSSSRCGSTATASG